MRLIDRKTLKAFWAKHPGAQQPLEDWFALMRACEANSMEALRKTWPSADLVGGKVVVFNIKGNHYRLISAIHFNRQTAYILEVMTHAEYSKAAWKKRYGVVSD